MLLNFLEGLSARKILRLILLSLVCLILMSGISWSETNINTGLVDDSIMGNNNQQANGAGIGVNGSVNGSNLNNNQNRNTNVLQPIMLSNPQYTGQGVGGNSAIVLPRNPLPMPNASLGRSNFGMQVGVQNNPGLSRLTGGKENGLGWFAQAGLTIPFGKIPTPYASNGLADPNRQKALADRRDVFGSALPQTKTNVKGEVVGLNAYNYSTISSGKLPLQTASAAGIGDIVSPPPKVLALKQASAYTQPLFTGRGIGTVEVGKEYPYLGHTQSGWVKIMLPNGQEAWTSTQFEYIRFDYTEIDTLALRTPSSRVAARPAGISTALGKESALRRRGKS